jgi:hypothetical protein
MRNKSYHSNTAFLDMMTNIGISMAALMMLILLMINVPEKKEDVKAFTKILITVSWPDESKDDVDLWVMNANKKIAFFGSKDTGDMFLDRDDLGLSSDMVYLPDGTVTQNKLNREVISIRNPIEGVYTVTVHLYRKNYDSPAVIPVYVEVTEFEPYRVIARVSKEFVKNHEEIHIINLKVNKDQKISSVNTERVMLTGKMIEAYQQRELPK